MDLEGQNGDVPVKYHFIESSLPPSLLSEEQGERLGIIL